ncbi:MAG: sulfatase [Caldilineaceae bacterium]
MERRPNILYIVVDCLRADRAFDASRTAQTPNLDRLRQSGTLFSHLITANSLTIPCMTTSFSGMYPRNHGVRAMKSARIADGYGVLAEILYDNGYHTYAEATGPLNPFFRLNRGFEHYQIRNGVQESFLGPWGDQFIDSFRQSTRCEPWFVYMHLWEVHQPRQVTPAYDTPAYGATRYDRAISSLDARLGQLFDVLDDNTMIIVTGDHGEKIPENNLEGQVERFKRPFTKVNRVKSKSGKLARGAVQHIRKGWQRTIQTMHRFGLVDNPLSSITGHGFHVYDSLTRVPLLVSGHTLGMVGQTIDSQVRQIDIMPTILDLVGLGTQTPASVDGRSLAPFLAVRHYLNCRRLSRAAKMHVNLLISMACGPMDGNMPATSVIRRRCQSIMIWPMIRLSAIIWHRSAQNKWL